MPDYREIITGIYFGIIGLIFLTGIILGFIFIKIVNSCSEHPVDAVKEKKPKKKVDGEKKKKKTGDKTNKKKAE